MNIFTDSQYFCGQIYRCVWIFKFTNKKHVYSNLDKNFPFKKLWWWEFFNRLISRFDVQFIWKLRNTNKFKNLTVSSDEWNLTYSIPSRNDKLNFVSILEFEHFEPRTS